ncbi:MAG: hypothetical protein EOP54_22665, partial [Sphingobacteriales bacterium]
QLSTTSTINYTTSVDANATTVRIRPTAFDGTHAVILVNGVQVISAALSDYITLNTDGSPTIITMQITAQDGVTTNRYSITVSRSGSNNAELKSIVLSPSSPLTQVATTASINYTASVDASLSVVQIRPTAVEANAQITVNGTTVISGALTPVNLNVGDNLVTIVVVAQDGVATLTYTIVINRPGMTMFSIVDEEDEVTGKIARSSEVTVSQALSPNSDGINDYLHISGIEACTDIKLSIMNSKGVLVFDIVGYDNITKVFNGHSKTGALLTQGTYFYLLDYKESGATKYKSGYIILKY